MTETVEVDLVRVYAGSDDDAGTGLALVIASERTAGHEEQIAAALETRATVFVDDLVDGTGVVRVITDATKEQPDVAHDPVLAERAVAATVWWFASLSSPVRSVVIEGHAVPADAVHDRVEFHRSLKLHAAA
ncbi:MAG TPA: hypothetical protein VNT53_07325 [Pseudolysinimonas sp.]|nr:hypothetical protein [Pseudolysinimonas sp.]